MRILANKDGKRFLSKVSLVLFLFLVLSQAVLYLVFHEFSWQLLLLSIIISVCILVICYQYLKKQDAIMEKAVSQMDSFISGNVEERIACEEEGELYRLFQRVNTLAAKCNSQLEKEIREKQGMKNTLLDISHQLKTPLAALNIYNGILQEEAGEAQDLKHFLDLSEQELDRIEILVQNLLKLAKLDAGTILFEKKKEKVAEMIRDIELRFHYRAKQEKKELRIEGEEDVYLFCDRSWMVEAVENLVKNALDHTGGGDFVEIKWKQLTQNVVQIMVKDSGCGIHPEDLYHVFKRFYRSRFSKDKQGIGLGLPLTKAVVEAHHGTIEVDSELGRGSTFELQFGDWGQNCS